MDLAELLNRLLTIPYADEGEEDKSGPRLTKRRGKFQVLFAPRQVHLTKRLQVSLWTISSSDSIRNLKLAQVTVYCMQDQIKKGVEDMEVGFDYILNGVAPLVTDPPHANCDLIAPAGILGLS